jgi:hypothetical protein
MSEKFISNPISFAGVIEDDAILGVSVATTGEALGHRLVFDDTSLFQLQQYGNSKSVGIKSRFTHPDWFSDGLGKYLGRFKNFRVEGSKLAADLHISQTAHTSPHGDIGRYVLDLAKEDPTALGVSVVVDLDRVWITSDGQELPFGGGKPSNAVGKYPVARITSLYAADVVDEPALNPEGLFTERVNPNGLFQSTEEAIRNLFNQEEQVSERIEAYLKGEKEMTDEVVSDRIKELELSVMQLQKTIEDSVIHIGNQPPRGQSLSMGPTGLETFQGYFDWLFGVPGAKLPPPELRRADALYRAVTGDVGFYGKFDPSHVAFAAATTTTLADLAVNAMNKVVLDLYSNLTAYRWYEQIVSVQATDGSLQDMQWLQMGGLTNLPVVAEGASYTELTPVDTKESSAFYKYGGYVGITDKMIRNSKIDEL